MEGRTEMVAKRRATILLLDTPAETRNVLQPQMSSPAIAPMGRKLPTRMARTMDNTIAGVGSSRMDPHIRQSIAVGASIDTENLSRVLTSCIDAGPYITDPTSGTFCRTPCTMRQELPPSPGRAVR